MDSAISKVKEENRKELVLIGEEFNEEINKENGGLPEDLYALKSLNFLEVARTELRTLHSALQSISGLTKLVIHSNPKLDSIPDELGSLSKLIHLDLSRNSIESLPKSLSNLEHLQIVIVSNNKLAEIPDLSKSAKKLTEVTFHDNALTDFPDWLLREDCVEDYIHLATINAGNNQISVLPPAIFKLSGLRLLNMSGNQLKTFPGEFAQCPRIKELVLNGNPLTDRRLQKLINDSHSKTSTIMDYIRKTCAKSDSSSGKAGKKGGKKAAKSAEESAEGKNVIEILRAAEEEHEIAVEPSVVGVRPHIICCIVPKVDLSEPGVLKKFLAIQNKLHDSEGGCAKRTVATVATHDLENIRFPLRYTTRSPDQFQIIPLHGMKKLTGEELVAQLNAEAEALRKKEKRNQYSGIHKLATFCKVLYLYMLKPLMEYSCLIDSEDEVVSFPPITNSDITKMKTDTKGLMLEVTSGESQAVCRKVMTSLILLMQNAGIGCSSNEDGSSKTMTIQQVKSMKKDGSFYAMFPDKTDFSADKLPTDICVKRDWLN